MSSPYSRPLCRGSELVACSEDAAHRRGDCQVCRGSYRLRLDGTLVKHRGAAD
jgi:hypothetical protein